MSALQVRFFGRFELEYVRKPLPLPATRKAQALLAYLILQREQPQQRDHLAELFWGDRPDEKARRSLSTAIWHISHCLPEKGYILSDLNTIQFNPRAALSLDIDEFEAFVSGKDVESLRTGIEVYRGEFLAGSYEDWVIHERYRLENLYLDSLARLMAAYEARADYMYALETALRLLNADTLREDAHRALMRTYCRLGKRNAALEQYQRCREIMQRELSAEPMLETQQLYQAILDGQFAPVEPVTTELQQVEIGITERKTIHNPLDLDALPPFLGREDEMAALDLVWQRARNTQGGLVLVQGEAGVGKTRLVEELANHLRWKGAQVLCGRCYEFERILPYQPVAEALRSVSPILARFDPDSEKSWIVQEILRLIPELAATYPDIPRQPALAADQEQARLFEGVSRFLSEISQPNGLLFVLEDLHWAAESSLELLHYLVRHLVACPVLFLGTVRPEELGRSHPLRSFQANLKQDGLMMEMHLKRLSETDTEALVTRLSGLGEAILPLARRLYQETEGNPFFLMETIKALFENQSISLANGIWSGDFDQICASKFPLPVSLSEAVRNRIQRLSDPAQEAVAIAAVIGREFDFGLLKEAWGRNEEQTLQALDVLLRRRLVEEGSGGMSRDYAFTHHKIQEVIYADLPQRRRSQLHARIGSILEGADFQGAPEHAGELAFHFCQSRQLSKEYNEKAIHYLLQAGDQARMVYAQKEASGYYNQALELLRKDKDYERTARVKMKLGVTYHNAFEYEQAHQAFAEGFRLWQRVSRSGQAALHPAPHALRTNWPPITSIDPAFAIDFASAIGLQLFSGLVAFSPDLEIVPDAAQKWEVYAGGREYIFQLKPDLQWSDGRPFTAYDFEFSGKRMLAPGTQSPFANLLYDISGARAYHQGQLPEVEWVGLRATDAATLVIQLEKPASYFIQLLANFLAVPQHCVELFGDKWTDAACIVSNGPFRMESWIRSESMHLVKNPGYHGQHAGNVHRVELYLKYEPQADLEKYAAGELDVLDMRFYPVAVYDEAVRQFVDEYISLPAASLSFIGFNVTRPPFQDERLRRAFALAIDKEMLADVIQRGSVFPATGGLVPPGLPGHSPGIGLPYDPGLAKAMLAEAGYLHGHGFPAVTALTPLRSDDAVSEALAAQWREVLGVEVAWKTVSPGLYLVLDKTPPDIFLSYWHADYPDPDDFLGASQMRRWTGWRDEAYLGLLEEARSIADQSKRMRVFDQADRLMINKAAIVPVAYHRQHLLLKPWVKRYPTSALFSWFWKDVVIEAHS